MHYGPVYEDRDQVLREAVYYGTEVSRAARIEPITPPGEIYATEAFAAALAFDAGGRFCADYVGRVQTAKNYGEFRMYHIRRSLRVTLLSERLGGTGCRKTHQTQCRKQGRSKGA
jgi:class 3 adenylate cyclase